MSIVSEMSTYVSGSLEPSQRLGISKGSMPSASSSWNIGRDGASGMTDDRASMPAARWSEWLMYRFPDQSRAGSGATITSGRRRRTSRVTLRRVSSVTSSIPSTSPRNVTLRTPSTSAAARCSRSRMGRICSRVAPGSLLPAEPSVMTT